MSLISEFAEVARVRPKQIALVTEKSQLSYQDLIDLVQCLDVELAARGVRSGQTLILDSARAEFCVAFALLLSLRSFTVVFTTTQLAVKSGMTFDRVVTTDPTDRVPEADQVVIDASWFAALGTYPLIDFLAHQSSEGRFVTQSSGSTGVPKYIAGTESERLRNAKLGGGFRGVPLAGRRFCSTLSPSAGWSITGNLAAILAGGSAVSLSGDQDRLPAFLDLYRVDALVTTPGIISTLLKLPDVGQFLTSLRDVRLGGATANRHLIEKFGRVCNANLHIGYGAAEIGTIFMSVQDPKSPAPEGYIGLPMRDDLEISFFKTDLTPLPNATEGVVGIRLKDPSMSREYLFDKGDGKTGLIEGCFFPGDIMRREADGYYYVGRVKNIINFSGNKFSLEAVTLALEEAHPESHCVVLVEPDEDGLERLVVHYVAEGPIDALAFARGLGARFPGLQVVRAVRHDRFPMTTTGKVDIEVLRKQDAGAS
jgi:acyl-coenzyme A synthetase/AMP-(fatty) acid ligase